MSKKILSLALVAVMLMSIFSLTVVAAGQPLDAIGVKVVSDAVIGAPAGTIVNVKVYYTVPEGTDLSDYAHGIGNTAIGYNNTAYKVNTESTSDAIDALTWGASYADAMSAACRVTITSTISNNIVKKFNANDTAQGWNAALQVQQAYNQNNGYSNATGYALDPECEVFTLQFVALKEITAADTIGVVVGAYGQSFFKVQYNTGKTNTAYAASAVDFSEAYAAPTAALDPTVEGAFTMGRMDDWNTMSFPFDAGIVGKISNLPITFDGKECVNLKNIYVTINGETVEAYNVYPVDGEENAWNFRAVIPGLTADEVENTEDMVCTFSIVVEEDGVQNTYVSQADPAFTTNLKAIYTTACTNAGK